MTFWPLTNPTGCQCLEMTFTLSRNICQSWQDLPRRPSCTRYNFNPYVEHVELCLDLQVHRLDATTSGVLLLAKSKDMHKTLTDLFRRRMIDKRYWALVRSTPHPDEGMKILNLYGNHKDSIICRHHQYSHRRNKNWRQVSDISPTKLLHFVNYHQQEAIPKGSIPGCDTIQGQLGLIKCQ